ncbi:hypothetical protein AANUM_0891 [Aggregatibacter actinomycetemcomitans NUM4039]|uniref:Uncharacterized protein n=1 Tax=Aggregatibacter actinomycetemcomitans TaxID=714 RepID=A0A2G1DMR2_AGGAC|nr:hypothetical protein [Aggregatibacter actinomycetemcomitans]PHO19750.1 hypothetical protein CQR80_10660 [Aggregatibacter actinomycetemcomitans]PHO22004.1 hypothetical protein CQR79_10615 [Aggregatibacter actinomycetemcomitans]BAS48122.1 hypothetical protein AANUM_0891 [Aggregatibacter actinomycetemcomitans NUM4039]
MSNTNTPTQPEIRNTATLWSIYSAIEEIYEIADATLDGKITKTTSTQAGGKVQIPFTHKDGLEFVLDRLSVVLSDIDDLKRQIEVLTNPKAERDYLTLPVVKLGGAQ